MGFSSAPKKIALIYALLGSVWIVVSDLTVQSFLPDGTAQILAQTLKGMMYIIVTALLIYWLALRAWQKVDSERAWYRSLFEMSPDDVFVVDRNGRFTDLNDAAVERYGYTREELLNMGPAELCAPSLRGAVEARMRACGTGPQRFDWRHLTRDGREIEVEIATRPLKRNGHTLVLGTVRDMTELRRTEAALRESEGRFRTMADNLPFVVWVHGPDGANQFVNRTFREYFGVSEEQMAGDRWKTLMHPDHAESYARDFAACVAERRPFHAVTRSRRHDGEWRWMESFGTPRFGANGEFLGFVGASIDISDRRLAEEELRNRERLLDRVFDILPVGLWVVDENGTALRGNPEGVRIWGRDLLVERDGYHQFTARRLPSGEAVAPDDWAVLRTLRDGSIVKGEMLEIDAFDGETRTLLHYTAPVTDDEGVPRYAVIANLDISELKRAEDALRESESRFRTMADNLPFIIWVHGPDGEQQFVNRTFCEFFGVREEEMRGDKWRTLTHPDDIDAYAAEFAACLTARRPFHHPVRVRRHDGEWRWIESFATPRFGANGEFLGLVGTSLDITERHAAEEQLRARERLLDRVFEILPVGLWFADRDGRLLRGNPAGVSIWGAEPHVPPSEYGVFRARRLPSGEELGPEDWALLRTVREHVTVTDELLEIDAFDGHRKVILNYTAPVLDDSGELQCAVVVNLDVTERRRAEEALAGQVDELRRWHDATLDRENRIIELKREVNRLLAAAGQPPAYQSVEQQP